MRFGRAILGGLVGASIILAMLFGSRNAKAATLKIRIGWIVAPAALQPGIARHEGVSYVLDPIHFQGSNLQIAALQSGERNIATLGFPPSASRSKDAGLGLLKTAIARAKR